MRIMRGTYGFLDHKGPKAFLIRKLALEELVLFVGQGHILLNND